MDWKSRIGLHFEVWFSFNESLYLGIISVGFDVTDQLLIGFFALIKCWRKIGNTM
jgi:hypothetical protein